jgi:hypothetical protein
VTNTNVFQLSQPGTFADPLTEVLRNGARALLAQAVEAEVGQSLLQVQQDAVVLHPGADRARTLEASTIRERAGSSQRSRKHILDHLPVEQGCCGMGSVRQNLGDIGANGFFAGRILRRGIGTLLPFDDGASTRFSWNVSRDSRPG